MKKILKITTLSALTIGATGFASQAFAHAGHVHEHAGHSHYIAIAACVVAGGFAVYLVAKSLKKRAQIKTKRAV